MRSFINSSIKLILVLALSTGLLSAAEAKAPPAPPTPKLFVAVTLTGVATGTTTEAQVHFTAVDSNGVQPAAGAGASLKYFDDGAAYYELEVPCTLLESPTTLQAKVTAAIVALFPGYPNAVSTRAYTLP